VIISRNCSSSNLRELVVVNEEQKVFIVLEIKQIMLRGRELIKYLVRFSRDYGATFGHKLNGAEENVRNLIENNPDLLERLQDKRRGLEYVARARCCAGRISE